MHSRLSFPWLSSLLTAVLLLVGTTVATAQECGFDDSRALDVPIEEILDESDPMIGNPDASVVMVEFFDPNCPHCRTLHPIVKEVVAEYEDRIRYYAKPFPLWDFSFPQIEAMLVADRIGKFYEMIDLQMENPQDGGIPIEDLAEMGAELGFSADRFASVLEAGPLQSRVRNLQQQGRQAGVRSTPTLTINNQVVSGNSRSVECLSQLLDEALEGDS